MSESPKSKTKFQAPKGMRDILPEEQIYWQRIEQVVKNIGHSYGFLKIDTPILEETNLFIKGTGADTDIVEKEMYSLRTKGGDFLTLRPEFTPGIVRAYLENGLTSWPYPVKLYSLGPLFRYERPQKGRFRQHHQANFEVIGEKDSVIDAQLVQLFFAISRETGLKGLTAQINSIGCAECRPVYRRLLVNYYRNKKNELCRDCLRRLQENPLRLLDCKEKKCGLLTQNAPQTIDHLCDACHNHFKQVLEFLDEIEVPYILNPRLVRGLDYYTRTVFEFFQETEEDGQIALGGGGRYDNLVKYLGGKDTPAAGFGFGIERMISLIRKKGLKIPSKAEPQVFLVQIGDLGKRKSLKLFEELRRTGLLVAESFSRDSIKSQLKTADKLGVKFSLILGQKEALDETIIIRDMSSGVQEIVPMEKVIKELKKRLKK
ncbi:MAG: histidine--tRNA ligase [Candidatus Portnoybacteria bacterium RIFCSPHIGHO2_01_FULL_40_12b]|uniref:Histidine--tRNA ligase n=1 Tax=Candidatus Portnoybacteria bacterium RIFCSPHIGHO2_01_FULL_40_12b TaxID=1801994 RepID=A0A1G2FAB1_9BACT|nr:MAG: histidine--tRNA ligase [Candidatus Portnoybacteria bacterium RIFCSPHIGHO2_01_FULL_40_12b]